MQLLAPIGPRVVPGRTIDILDVAPDGGMSRGFARVDVGDPVFFDHPLDHVPGMLLAVASLELAEHGSMLEPDNVTFRLTFTNFCELGAPVEVTATREADGTSRIEFIQSGRSIAKGLLARRDTQPLMESAAVPALGDGPISGELVHRCRDRTNIKRRTGEIRVVHYSRHAAPSARYWRRRTNHHQQDVVGGLIRCFMTGL